MNDVIHTVFLGTIFFVWLILTWLNQVNCKLAKLIKAKDIFNLLPKWTFFAPKPAMNDLHLLYRERDSSNNVSLFKEVRLLKRGPSAILLNPSKRKKKALQDLVRGLSGITSVLNDDPIGIKLSFYYLALLNCLTSLDKDPSTSAIQFVIIKGSGFDDQHETELVLVSDFHNV